jgi:putative glutamine amidotransferase
MDITSRQPPVIGITCTDIKREQAPPGVGQNRSYIDALVQAGAAPILIPHPQDETRLRGLYERLHGLLLPGGLDVNPAHYGEPKNDWCGSISPSLDRVELALARWAAEEGKPLLAICRGIQVLNVALGGTLYQDIKVQVPGAEKHDWYPGYPRDKLAHSVAVEPHTRLAHILGAASVQVNSLHHQAIKDLAPGLSIIAQAPDGIVEAVEAKAHPFALGVQWHPEELVAGDAGARHLFDALVEACRP